ncbi:MAG: hypothetical protein IJQ32_07525 [Paludibacteraceae bacterium]|nr:hypothetical protein [Paludibacteraceae bacterium]
MRKIFIIGALCTMCCTSLWAQATAAAAPETPRMDDKERIALTPIVLDDEIPAGAHKQLENKMTQVAAKSGCAAISNSRFIFTCSADILTKDITPTAPPMHAYTVALTFYIGDGVEGRLFSSYTIESKGVGQTPDKAYINALKNVRTNDPGFKAMVDKGKKEIIAYYNTNCDIVIEDAKTMVKRHEFSNAIDVLTGIPTVCEECYRRAQDESLNAYQAWRDEVCLMALNKAQAAWATRDAKAAAEALEYVPTDGACVGDADALKKEIAAKLDAKERQEWEFKMRQYEDQQALREERAARGEYQESSQQQALQVATNAVSEYKGGNKGGSSSSNGSKPKYQVKGKWFK